MWGILNHTLKCDLGCGQNHYLRINHSMHLALDKPENLSWKLHRRYVALKKNKEIKNKEMKSLFVCLFVL